VVDPLIKKIKVKADENVYNNQLTEKPEFEGGMELYKFVGENFRAPEGLKGKVYITLLLRKDGSIND
jgi:hypothetical protein